MTFLNQKNREKMKDKRKYPRVKIIVPISFDCFDEDGQIVAQRMGVVLDVSQGGLLIESDQIIDANYVKIVFVNYDNKVLSIVGSVVHSRKIDKGKARTGVCFHGRNSERIKFVTDLIRSYHHGKKTSSLIPTFADIRASSA